VARAARTPAQVAALRAAIQGKKQRRINPAKKKIVNNKKKKQHLPAAG
jgi:hypothetical protein